MNSNLNALVAIGQKLQEVTDEVKRRRRELRIARLALENALLKRIQLENRHAAQKEPTDGVQLELKF
jgi:hypothetical protein